jgi:hypothetical protein
MHVSSDKSEIENVTCEYRMMRLQSGKIVRAKHISTDLTISILSLEMANVNEIDGGKNADLIAEK